MTVRQKLGLAFGLLAFLVLLVAGLSVRSMGSAHQDFVNFVDGVNARAQLADGVRSAVDERAIAARNLVLVDTPADTAAERAAVLKAHDDVSARLTRLKQMVGQPEVSQEARDLVREIDRVEALYGPVALGIVDLALAGKKGEATVRINTECRPLLAALVKSTVAYADYTEGRARRLIDDASTSFERQRAMLIAACAVALLAAVVAGYAISRNLSRALGAEPNDLNLAAQQVAHGNLGTLHHAANALPSSVMASLQHMQSSLSQIVREVRNASDSIATGSTQIAQGNNDLSQRTEEQASALEQTSATMDELGATVRQNAEHAVQADMLASKASTIALRGGEVVDRVVQTMSGINEGSRKISEIISTVEGIAFQTNILALNAAVEAARAGEQGRGFAVVASEVRNLAQRSADAAKEIRTLIGDSVDQVRLGSELVDQAGTTMGEIVAAIKQVSESVAQISLASTEQSAGVGQVAEAVTQIDQVTQQNAALVEEMAAAAGSLQQQARQLVAAVSVFTLGDQGDARSLSARTRFAGPSAAAAAAAQRSELVLA